MYIYFFLGSALIKVGQCQQKLGQVERDFIGVSANCYIQPLRKFLDGEMKTISKEMSILESKRWVHWNYLLLRIEIGNKTFIDGRNFSPYRLDLDACKSRVRKARSQLGQQNVGFKTSILRYSFTEFFTYSIKLWRKFNSKIFLSILKSLI